MKRAAMGFGSIERWWRAGSAIAWWIPRASKSIAAPAGPRRIGSMRSSWCDAGPRVLWRVAGLSESTSPARPMKRAAQESRADRAHEGADAADQSNAQLVSDLRRRAAPATAGRLVDDRPRLGRRGVAGRGASAARACAGAPPARRRADRGVECHQSQAWSPRRTARWRG